jgi:hypothetical protein
MAARSRPAKPSGPLGGGRPAGAHGSGPGPPAAARRPGPGRPGAARRRVGDGVLGLAAGAVTGVVPVTPMAADQTRVRAHHRPAADPLQSQRPRPPDLTPDRAGMANQAVQLHGHRQLGADPPARGSRPPLEAAAGQLGQGISVALATAASRLWPASASTSPSTATDHAVPGQSQPQPRR